jgi:ribonuclease Y
MEAAHLAGLMAPEIGLDPETARRAALFHDLGKAVDHEVEGRHAEIGADLLRKAGESETIVEAVRGHHDGPEPGSAYAALVAAADAVTAAVRARRGGNHGAVPQAAREPRGDRQGRTRRGAQPGHAGRRELRVFVEPTEVDDAAAHPAGAADFQEIEDALDYPGQIKVTVIRETRCVEYAR